MNKPKNTRTNLPRFQDDDNDEAEEAILMQAAEEASRKAVEESQALGLSFHIIRDNKIIAIHPDNSEEVIKELPPRLPVSPELRKGVALKLKLNWRDKMLD